ECPICDGLSLGERKKNLSQGKSAGFRARAVHNAFHYNLELQTARSLQGTDSYKPYIEKRVKKSSGFYKMLWKLIKKYYNPLQSLTLDAYLTERCKGKRKITDFVVGYQNKREIPK
ncbi:MAG: hypothetical protein ACTSRK_21215, partial [Promethearchaeota archaeon]